MTPGDVVLTGRGVVSPLGVGVEQHWEALAAGRSAVVLVERLRALGLHVARGAEVGLDLITPHLWRLPKKQQKLYNRATFLAMLGASLAMEDAGLPAGAGEPSRFGVLLGVNTLSWDVTKLTEYLIAAESTDTPGTLEMPLANSYCMRNINPLDYSLKTLPNLSGGHVAIAHDAQGCCRALTEGQVGGARAIGQAFRLISEGELDVVLCGGADVLLEGLIFATYCGAGLLASDDGVEPGSIAGEGSGLLVLERGERATRRGATVHGEILAFSSAAGDGRLTSDDDPHSQARRLSRVIEEVLDEAGDYPDLISLHGDGAPNHDRAEEIALRDVLNGRAESLPRLRMKSLHGDLGAASTPVELLSCSVALERSFIPEAMTHGGHPRPSSLRRALAVSIGLFGECAALMLGAPRAD
jgi:3-oxoacyl-[acyl-carrier-protein] synthase II